MNKHLPTWFLDLGIKIMDRCKVSTKSYNGSPCLEYFDYKTYGVIFDKITKKPYKTHRVICTIFHGQPKKGQVVNHLCSNPSCCNPNHLEWSTPKDNVKYSMTNGNRKLRLTKADVEYIINSDEKLDELASKFKVSKSYISQIRSGQKSGGY